MADPDIYTIGWICAITTEFVAARAFLDEEHSGPKQVAQHDNNSYTLGQIGKHNIVIAVLPDGDYGTASAAGVARDMLHSFPNVRIGLMVGIGGGAPSEKHDIRLGDIVVSAPRDGHGGVFQYDFGKTIQCQEFQTTRFLDQPPTVLRTAVSGLKAQYEADGHQIQEAIQAALEKKPRLRRNYNRPDANTDRLYHADAVHPPKAEAACLISCGSDISLLVERQARDELDDNPTIHYGLIASANQLMKDAIIRDRLAQEKDVLCFEMEAAGLMNHFPCLVIRGICDYSDTHKDKQWQGYAAMAAAAYAKDLLKRISPSRVEAERKLVEVLSDVDSKLENIDSQMKTTHTEIKSIRMDKHSDDIMQWLAPPDVSSNFNKAIKTRHPGSGRRLLESEAYTKWKTGDSSFLWLYGIPGCGKTILASTVIEDLQKSQSHAQTLLYFYFDFTDNRKQSFENTLRSLVWQIYYQNEVARKHLDPLYSFAYQNGKMQPSFDFLQKAFTEIIGNLGEIWIILDALDECTPRGDLLTWLRNVNQDFHKQVILHVLVTSRPEQDIESAIKRFASDGQMIAIRDDLLEADIRNYVQARVREHEGLSRWRKHKEIQDQIEASLLEKANGMFRWVSCQLDALEDCLERKSLLKALQDLPKTLDETYARILANIPSAHMHHTIRILQFLTYSERPLRLDEAVDAIAVDVREDVARGCRFDPKDRLPVPEEITRYCSSLVVLVSRHGRYGEEQEVTEIQLAHFSVKDYLTSDRQESTTAQYLSETSARSSISAVCIAYLLELEQIKRLKATKAAFPFAKFSAQYWGSHAMVSEQISEYTFKLAKELFLDQRLIENWWYLYKLETPWQDESKGDDIAPALYYASLIGLQRCVNMLLDKGADVNAYGGEYGNALQAASYGGHREIVQLLLDKRADVNIQGGSFGNALQAASDGGHRNIVQLLLDKGANVNIQGGFCGNAFQAASCGGHQDTVQLLLDKGANVNVQGGHYGNALQAASCGGHQDIVQLLLDKGADVNIQGGHYGNALQAASYGGHRNIVQLLLDKGANVNAHSGEYGNALQAASKGGRFRASSSQEYGNIVQLLLDKGANVHAGGGVYGNALQAASYGGHQNIVQLLLDKGADVNIQGGHYGNALQAASEGGYQGIVHLLIDKGADVNIQGGLCSNALQAASSRGHREIVQLLLDKGADVNAQGGHYGNALYAASYGGYRNIAQLLFKKGANINARGGRYGNALQAASYGGHQDIVQLLLDKGANVNAYGGHYGNALQAALYGGHQKIVQLLLDKGADVNIQGGHYGNALQAASCGGHQDIVQLLLEKGANINARGGRYGNALQAALEEGYLGIAKLLVNDEKFQITDTMVRAAANNSQHGLEVMRLLFGSCNHTQITLSTQSATLNNAALSGKVDMVKLLLDEDVDCTIADQDGWTPLLNASYNGHIEIMKLLLRRDNNIDIADIYGHTALYYAAKNGSLDVVDLLLSDGIGDINAVDNKRRTPLLRASSAGHTAIVDLLLGMHADPMITDDCGTTCIGVASRNGHLEVVQSLFGHGADWSTQDDAGLDAMQWAVWEARNDIELFLRSNGAAVSDDVYGFRSLFKDQ